MAKRLDQAGADGLVLFNRFCQPDIDLHAMEVTPEVLLSTTEALRLPLTWIGILYGRVKASLAGTSGIHGPEDVVNLLMVGANVTMLCSTLMRNGLSNRGLAARATLWRSFGANLRPRTRVRRVKRPQRLSHLVLVANGHSIWRL